MRDMSDIPAVASRFLGLLLALLGVGAGAASTITSSLPSHFTPGVAFGVSLAATPDALTSVYSVEETPPTNWVVSAMSHGGVFDGSVGAVKWGPFLDATPRVLSYQIQPLIIAVGTNFFTGRAAFDAGVVAVGGVRSTVKFPGTLTRTLPVDYLPGVALDITFAAVPAGDVVVWAVEEQLPDGWGVTAISHEGGFDPEANKIRWGPFLDATPRTLTYTILPPPAARTNVVFAAAVRFDEGAVVDEVSLPIRPSRLVRSGPATYLPGVSFLETLTATPAPYVSAMAIEEALLAGWTPTDVSAGGVWDGANRKLKWGPFIGAAVVTSTFSYRLTPAVGVADPLALAAAASFDAVLLESRLTITRHLTNPVSTVVRGLPAVYRPGQTLTVTNTATPMDTALVYAVEDAVPAGWVVSAISGGGAFDAANRRVKWGPYFDSTATVRVLTYQATPPANAFGNVSFDGLGRFDTTTVTTGGANALGNAPATVVRSLPTGYLPGVAFAVTLTATPVPGVETYAVEETVPAGWTVSGLSDGGVVDTVNQKLKWGPFLDANLRPLTYTVTPPGGATGTNHFAGQGWFNAVPVETGGPADLGRTPPQVVGRRVFYNQSAWDGNGAGANAADDGAVGTDKAALLTAQKAGLANYTSYTRGLNGIMVDVLGLPAGAGPVVADFAFRTGNNNTVGGWVAGPAPLVSGGVTVRRGAGVGGSDRITLIWGADAATKKWLQVRVKAGAATGLAVDDVFYFGNAIGETGNQAGVSAIVNATDEILTRNNPRSLFSAAPVTFAYDFNRDKQVNATDQIAARLNTTSAFTALALITPALPGSPALAGRPRPGEGPLDEGGEGGEPELAEGELGIAALTDGNLVLHARGSGLESARLEMKRAAGGWGLALQAAETYRDGEVYWRLGSPGASEGWFYRLTR